MKKLLLLLALAGTPSFSTAADKGWIEAVVPPAGEMADAPDAAPAVVPEMTTAQARELSANTHDALEGDEHYDDRHWFWKAVDPRVWARNVATHFNMRRMFLSMRRWFRYTSTDVQMHEHAVNLGIMYAFTHHLEMAVSGVVIAWVPHSGLPTWAQIAVTSGAALMALPMPFMPIFEPFCAAGQLLVWTFPKRIHKLFKFPRFLILTVGGAVAKYSGAAAASQWAVGHLIDSEQGKDLVQRILSNQSAGRYRWEVSEERIKADLFHDDGSLLVRLTMVIRKGGGLGLESVQFPKDVVSDHAERRALQRALAPFGYDVRTAVLQGQYALRLGKIDRFAKAFYVKSVSENDEGTLVHFHSHVILRGSRHTPVHPWTLTKKIGRGIVSCAQFFAGGDHFGENDGLMVRK